MHDDDKNVLRMDEDGSSASTAASISPLSPLFAGKDGMDLTTSHPEKEEGERYMNNNNEKNHEKRPHDDEVEDEDDDEGLYMDEHENDTATDAYSSSLSSHRRLPSTIYEEKSVSAASQRATEFEQQATSFSMRRTLSSSRCLGETSPSASSYNTNYHDSSGAQLHGLSSSDAFGDESSNDQDRKPLLMRRTTTLPLPSLESTQQSQHYTPYFSSTRLFHKLSTYVLRQHTRIPHHASTWLGFWALFLITCANYVLTPMRDAIALQVGVSILPMLTLASTALAVCSSVPIGWLFEAPDPARRKVWKKMGLTRGQTQGSSLALFYRCFGWFLLVYAGGFVGLELCGLNHNYNAASSSDESSARFISWNHILSGLYIAFFLVVHLMKLHSLSLIWGVTTEAMEYEEVARQKMNVDSSKTRLQKLALVGFGGTLGGILGSGLASTMAHILKLPGLLLVAAILLEISAELSIELGRIMQTHWEEQQIFQSSNDLTSLDPSMKRSGSLNSMKRISSGNSLNHMKRVASGNTLHRAHSSSELKLQQASGISVDAKTALTAVNEDSFFQRLLRGVTTILRSRLLMSIFTYNALYASTTVLLSFQRAALVSNRSTTTTTEADTAFLANVNMASSLAIFSLQATGLGAFVAHKCGPRGTLSLMPLIRLLGVLALAWWHRVSDGQPPNLLIFLVVDECCKIMNLAVAKPVRESLWRGLSNEARYEAKPIVDTLANRWGGGSAAFLVSFLSKCLDLFGVEPGPDGVRSLFGFPPIILLCLVIAAWWTAVSADLGMIRTRIDMELKKMQ